MRIGLLFVTTMFVAITLLASFRGIDGFKIERNKVRELRGDNHVTEQNKITNGRTQTGIRGRVRYHSYSGRNQRGGDIRPGYSGGYSSYYSNGVYSPKTNIKHVR